MTPRFSPPTEFTAAYMDLDGPELARQRRLAGAGLLETAEVLLPEPDTPGGALVPEGADRHFGWPVAAMIGDRIVVAFTVSGAGPHIIRSPDAGRTWERPRALKDFYRHPGSRGPGMIALGVTRDGLLALSCSRGVFTSADQGETWVHQDVRLGPEDRLANAGPRILDHPRFGLVLPYHVRGGDRERFALHFLVSRDTGRTWTDIGPVSAPDMAPAEPTLFAWKDRLGVFSRNHSPGRAAPMAVQGPYSRRWNYFVQFRPRGDAEAGGLDSVSFEAAPTPIYLRTMDTPDAVFNPVSGRIEAVVSKRNDGFPDTDRTYRTLSLWSIDPEAFFDRGDTAWRFECVLLRNRRIYGGHPGDLQPARDGLHPAGAVLDLERGLQHIFIYTGSCSHIYGRRFDPPPRNPPDRATGIFRVSRSLDTGRLCDAARQGDGLANAFRIDDTFVDLKGWTPAGGPLRLAIDPVHPALAGREAPPPAGPAPHTGPGGLAWETDRSVFLFRQDTVLLPDYRIEVEMRIDRYAAGADTFGLAAVRGAWKQYLILRNDGVYDWPDPRQPPRRVWASQMDRDTHTWTLDGCGEQAAELRRDGVRIARLEAMFEPDPGRDDAPLSLFVSPTPESGPVSLRLFRLSLAGSRLREEVSVFKFQD